MLSLPLLSSSTFANATMMLDNLLIGLSRADIRRVYWHCCVLSVKVIARLLSFVREGLFEDLQNYFDTHDPADHISLISFNTAFSMSYLISCFGSFSARNWIRDYSLVHQEANTFNR